MTDQPHDPAEPTPDEPTAPPAAPTAPPVPSGPPAPAASPPTGGMSTPESQARATWFRRLIGLDVSVSVRGISNTAPRFATKNCLSLGMGQLSVRLSILPLARHHCERERTTTVVIFHGLLQVL